MNRATRSRMMHRRKRAALLFILPSLLVLILFMLVPILYGFGISLTNYNMSMPANMRRFVGISNYIKVINDHAFQNAIGWTFAFAGIAVIGTVILAMLLALALNSKCMQGLHGRLIKTGFILPMMLCPLVVANVWYIIFAPNYGLINSLLRQCGLPTISFMGTTFWARTAIIIVELWWGTPYVMIILLAALTTVPSELYEAADIEGASTFQKFFRITIPCINQFLVLVISIRVMDALRMFDISYAMTEGGPQRTTETISVYIYKTAFSSFRAGEGAAAAFILFLLVAVVTFLFMKLSKRATQVEAEGGI